MPNDYPADADGDALRRIADRGADMLRPMMIEFTVYAPTMENAKSMASVVSGRGYSPSIYVDDQTGSISLYCARTMLATHSGVTDAQAELNELGRPFGAECDGWITVGNRTDH